MEQIRIHGRGGQGSVTMAQMLAQAAFEGDKWSQGFPSYGVERRGAPIQAFARIDDVKITDRSQVDNPDFVIVQDSTLVGLVDVLDGRTDGGLVLVNTASTPEEVGLETNEKIVTIDATSIALDHLGKPIMNTSLLGAFAGATGLIDIDDLEEVIKRKFPGEIGDKNVAAAREAYERVKEND